MSLKGRIKRKFNTVFGEPESLREKEISKRNLLLMQSSNEIPIKKLANVLESVASNRFTKEETEWFSKIEALRNNLLNSTEIIQVMDYGPGHRGVLRTQEEMDKGVVGQSSVAEMCKKVSSPATYCRLLFKIVYDFKVQKGIELGTALGISCAYQSAGMDLNNSGEFITCEGSPGVASVAEKNIQSLGLNRTQVVQGRFHDTYDGVLAAQHPVDYIFIDGNHDEFATVEYFEKLIPHLSETAVVVFDDIDWSQGMKRAWKKIISKKEILATVALKNLGIVITDNNSQSPPTYYEFFLDK